MKMGMLTVAFLNQPLSDTLDFFSTLGLSVAEIPAGGFFGTDHCHPAGLLSDASKLDKFQSELEKRGFEISALAMHGNPLHPNPEIASTYADEFALACEFAERMGVGRLTLLAGLPAGGPSDDTPNWITFPFPPELEKALEWQWEERVLPYWHDKAPIAERHGVKLCFEMVPNDCVYNPRTLKRLRDEIGPVVGANLDPSHFFFQGIDPIAAVYDLGDGIYHVHAKDAANHPEIVRVDGLLEPRSLGDVKGRSWSYRTLGWGHGAEFWRDFVSALRMVGYDDVLSIEHEDTLLSTTEGAKKAVQFLSGVIPTEATGKGWWEA